MTKGGILTLSINGTEIKSGKVTVGRPSFRCSSGQIWSQMLCYPCPKGSYFNTSTACEACGINTYQDKTGQLTCKKCKPERFTEQQGSKNSSDCKCPAGTYYKQSGDECVACMKGTYQNETGQNSCNKCPSGQSTKQIQSKTVRDCMAACPPGYKLYQGTCYKLYSAKVSYQQANMSCSQDVDREGGMLSVVNSKAIFKMIARLAGGNSIWIGLDDMNKEGAFENADGSPLGSYSEWNPGEPDGGRQANCVIMDVTKSYMWSDVSCDTAQSFICQIEAVL